MPWSTSWSKPLLWHSHKARSHPSVAPSIRCSLQRRNSSPTGPSHWALEKSVTRTDHLAGNEVSAECKFCRFLARKCPNKNQLAPCAARSSRTRSPACARGSANTSRWDRGPSAPHPHPPGSHPGAPRLPSEAESGSLGIVHSPFGRKIVVTMQHREFFLGCGCDFLGSRESILPSPPTFWYKDRSSWFIKITAPVSFFSSVAPMIWSKWPWVIKIRLQDKFCAFSLLTIWSTSPPGSTTMASLDSESPGDQEHLMWP